MFSRITGPISTKLGTNHSWVQGIQVCSNERTRPFPRGDNKEITNIHWRNLKIFFLRTTGPISAKFGTKHPSVMQNHVCSNDGTCPFPRGDQYEIVKIYWQTLKIIFSRTKLSTKHPWLMGINFKWVLKKVISFFFLVNIVV